MSSWKNRPLASGDRAVLGVPLPFLPRWLSSSFMFCSLKVVTNESLLLDMRICPTWLIASLDLFSREHGIFSPATHGPKEDYLVAWDTATRATLLQGKRSACWGHPAQPTPDEQASWVTPSQNLRIGVKEPNSLIREEIEGQTCRVTCLRWYSDQNQGSPPASGPDAFSTSLVIQLVIRERGPKWSQENSVIEEKFSLEPNKSDQN